MRSPHPRALQCVRCARVYVSHTGTGMGNSVCMHLVTTAVVVDGDAGVTTSPTR
jgi:hypothetical protein